MPLNLVHAPDDGDQRVLATDVETADTLLAQGLGLMFRRSFDGALAFRFSRVGRRSLHMVCVPFPIDAVWTVEDRVERVARLRPWVGLASARADAVYELPAGAADGVEPGDVIRLAPLDSEREAGGGDAPGTPAGE